MFTANNVADRSLGLELARRMVRPWQPTQIVSNYSCVLDVWRWNWRSVTTSRTTNPWLPRSIASFAAFENAMCLDIAMGGSTNTILHLLAAAQAGVAFTMNGIDHLSRKVPQLCKVAPSTQLCHMEDVHRAGGVMGILGELDRAGLLNRDVGMVHSPTLATALEQWDIKRTADAKQFIPSSALHQGNVPTQTPSAKANAGTLWTTIALTAASVTSPTLTAPKAV